MLPLMLLNFLGGIGSGIWLALLGQWWAVGYGITAIFLSHFFLSFIMMPGLIFGAPAAMLIQKGRLILAFPLVLLSQLYIYTVIVIWCLIIFFFFMSKANPNSFFPLLIWSYGVALGPLVYLAQQDRRGGGGEASSMTTFFAQIAYIVMALVAAFTRKPLLELAIIFSGIMLTGLFIQIGIAVAILREQAENLKYRL